MGNIGIYSIMNTTNKYIYIGSSVNLKKREQVHFRQLKLNKHHSILLQRSYNKHGVDNFKFNVLEYCDKNLLLLREQYYIDTFNPRYNVCKIAGSPLGVVRTELTKKKLSEAHMGQPAWNKGVPASELQKQNQSSKMKGKASGSKGKSWTKEAKEAFSAQCKGRRPGNIIPVCQYTLDNVFIAEFYSVSEAERLTGTKGIHRVLTGKAKHANKFLWKRKE